MNYMFWSKGRTVQQKCIGFCNYLQSLNGAKKIIRPPIYDRTHLNNINMQLKYFKINKINVLLIINNNNT